MVKIDLHTKPHMPSFINSLNIVKNKLGTMFT